MHRELLGTSIIKKKRSTSVLLWDEYCASRHVRFARIREEEYPYRLPVWSPPYVAAIFFFLPRELMFWRVVDPWTNPWPNC